MAKFIKMINAKDTKKKKKNKMKTVFPKLKMTLKIQITINFSIQ